MDNKSKINPKAILPAFILLSIIFVAMAGAPVASADGDETTYTVTFDSDGGSAVEPIDVTTNDPSIETAPVTTKDDNDFAGWYDDTTLIVWPYEPEDNITLTAHWTASTVEPGPTDDTDEGNVINPEKFYDGASFVSLFMILFVSLLTAVMIGAVAGGVSGALVGFVCMGVAEVVYCAYTGTIDFSILWNNITDWFGNLF